MGRYLPAETQLTELPMPTQDVVLQLFSHRSVEVPIGVPAVVEPLLVLVLAGAAQVEGAHTGRPVEHGERPCGRLLPDRHGRAL